MSVPSSNGPGRSVTSGSLCPSEGHDRVECGRHGFVEVGLAPSTASPSKLEGFGAGIGPEGRGNLKVVVLPVLRSVVQPRGDDFFVPDPRPSKPSQQNLFGHNIFPFSLDRHARSMPGCVCLQVVRDVGRNGSHPRGEGRTVASGHTRTVGARGAQRNFHRDLLPPAERASGCLTSGVTPQP